MTEKLIIDNRTDLPMTQILSAAHVIVSLGRISGDSYCHVTEFKDGLVCLARRNVKADTLVFIKEGEQRRETL